MKTSTGYIQQMNNSIRRLFVDALKISAGRPALAAFILKTIIRQKRAAVLRQEWEEKGTHVPPFIIASITQRCNLNCKGCYAMTHRAAAQEDMDIGHWRAVMKEARELGISIALLAGGEPFARIEFLDIVKENKEIIFPVFTNGLLIDYSITEFLKAHRNLVPVISLEGYRAETDERRGSGVYERTAEVMEQLNSSGIFFGTSLTVTRENFDTLTSEGFVAEHIKKGCRLFFYVEYTPVESGTEKLAITEEQRNRLDKVLNSLRRKFRSLFIAFPGDEKNFGGCLSSGRGFDHINPRGELEPCPFAPFSDTDVKHTSLKEALQSKFLRTLRESPEQLRETEGGCALFTNREWVKSVLDANKCDISS
jgi:MoaA/NifB/PqqE/SkfB family radical SAM enzyme